MSRRTRSCWRDTSCPSMKSSPEVFSWIVHSVLMVVLFPAPLGPRKAKIVPRSTLNEMSSTAVKSPYVLEKWLTSMIRSVFPCTAVPSADAFRKPSGPSSLPFSSRRNRQHFIARRANSYLGAPHRPRVGSAFLGRWAGLPAKPRLRRGLGPCGRHPWRGSGAGGFSCRPFLGSAAGSHFLCRTLQRIYFSAKIESFDT